ncbi:ATP-binding cassette ATPase Uup [Alteromonas oceanisediminis]|uniref:ATP-binding cassette ATPase Uup n=1 Tax=Alteromonas oceanisediminis TaxID=2836180 RepID=UPI001BD93DDC|nr:ATP-binding cassette domain-containing protein [Alteromonas oceanisediminis]MBT0587111.1 ATP-binding cassette domain-containing protein [Alteromonas oceanisediminis]
MSLVQLKNVSVLYGTPPLLDGVDFVLHAKERVCIVGRNGSGKSTLMRLLANEIQCDEGVRVVPGQTRIARLPQDPPESVNVSMFDYVAEGLAKAGELLKQYFRQIKVVETDYSETQLNKLQRLQEQLEVHDAWKLEQQIGNVLTMLNLDPEQSLASLSGGWRRKAALARALVGNPDVLLLDEPTNHLDIEMIRWLEGNLKAYQGAIVFISHDRAFIRNLATRIVDLDRGQLTSYPGDYATYLVKKAEDLEIEANHQAEFDKKLAKEEVWIRQGIKARRTRNEGRVRALKRLREERSARRTVVGNAKIAQNQSARSGKRVFETDCISYAIDEKPIVSRLSVSILRGDKVAIVGPNGCGKSTLIKLLLGDLTPQSGEIKRGVNLDIAYFDQHRSALDLDKTLIDTVGDGKRDLTVNGQPRHVMSYLQDYLFSPERANVPVRALSGGEKNRLMLAKLMLKPSNLLILDEPTNDLDVETLELLESLLVEYDGTVLLVSHDREFVDNVVSSSLYFEGNGVVQEFVGGYSDIQQWYQNKPNSGFLNTSTEKAANNETSKPPQSPSESKQQTDASTQRPKKLSYKDQRELDALPGLIEDLELRQAAVQEAINAPGFFELPADQTAVKLEALAELQTKLENAYARWDALEDAQE